MNGEQLDPWAIRTADPELLANWRIICLAETQSTSDVVRRFAVRRHNSFLAVFADWQSAGRGQAGRHWVAPPGLGLLGTTLWHPKIDPGELQHVVQAAGMAVVDAFACLDVLVRLKWPNDIVIAGAKCGGILVESVFDDGEVQFVSIGIGLNILQSEFELPPVSYPATSIRLATGRIISRTKLAARLLRALEYRIQQMTKDPGRLLMEWSGALVTIGQLVRISTSEGIIRGTAVSVRPNGGLVVRSRGGRESAVLNGEVLPD